MAEPYQKTHRGWPGKFRGALRGLAVGIRGQSSFRVHFLCAGLVILAGGILQVGPLEWCVLIVCIFSVFTAELFNSALESLAPAIDDRYNRHLADALDIASAAVLMCAIGAVLVGLVLFGSRVCTALSG